MSRRQYANKKDANQPDIEKALLRIGAQYIDTSDLKKDGFDLLVLFRGQAFIVEVKNPDILPKYFFTLDAKGKRERLKKTLTDKERGAMKKCEKTGNKYIITYSADHCLREIGAYAKPFQNV